MKSALLLLTGVVGIAIGLLPACGLFQKERQEQQPLKFLIIDTLAPELFEELHLKGAINIPYALESGEVNPAYKSMNGFQREIEKKTGSSLAEGARLFFYCADDMCTSSKITADLARSWGYNAAEYDSGLKGWFALSLYDPKKDQYQLTPTVKPGTAFKHHTYLNSVVEQKPDEVTLNKWRSDAQPLVDAMKSK